MGANATGNDRQPVLKTVAQAAEYLGVSDRTMRRYIKAGKIGTVEVDGVCRVQQTDLDNLAALDRHIPANAIGIDRHLSDPAEDVLRETVRRQDSEIAFLRTELTAIRATLDRVTLMLPAAQKKGFAWGWIVIIAAAIVAAAAGGYWLWLGR